METQRPALRIVSRNDDLPEGRGGKYEWMRKIIQRVKMEHRSIKGGKAEDSKV